MPTESHQEKQHALEQCVKDMACRMYDETGIGALACKLQEIYEGEFRHNYSPFFRLYKSFPKIKEEAVQNFYPTTSLRLVIMFKTTMQTHRKSMPTFKSRSTSCVTI